MSEAAAKKCPAGAPPWVMTFADLMSLLMCFFVLLLSFSEMDIMKYKQVAGSMKDAFGVQRLIESKIMPKGTSIIAREFSPGKPTKTAIQEMRQQTTDDTKDNLDFSDAEFKSKGENEAAEKLAVQLREELAPEVEQGLIDIETRQGKTIIRIREKGSFPSGNAVLNPSFEPVIKRISDTLARTPGQIVISGHTDDIPISTDRYRSNWELSAGRAVTVIHALLKYNPLGQERFVLEGLADSRPLESNATPQGRARNRRVEIAIQQELPGSDRDAADEAIPPATKTSMTQGQRPPHGEEKHDTD